MNGTSCLQSRKSIFLGMFFLVFLVPSSAQMNSVRNGMFTCGTDDWALAQNGSASGSSFSINHGLATIGIGNSGNNAADVELKQAGIALVNAKTYDIQFDARTNAVPKTILVEMVSDATPATSYWSQQVNLTAVP
jgi:hypothetical protein